MPHAVKQFGRFANEYGRSFVNDSSTPRQTVSIVWPRASHSSIKDVHLPEQRLLSPEQAAAYLGLRSRFAVYRLVASGQLPALRLANKLRLDLRDLDAMIESAKATVAAPAVRAHARPTAARSVPRVLAPRRTRRDSVTPRVTAPTGGT
jgi:excisionase family DNA binding protein